MRRKKAAALSACRIEGMFRMNFKTIMVLAGLALTGTAVWAQSIPLINAGFENPPAKPGVMTTGGIPGWPATSPAPTVGVANLPATTFFPPTDGSQVGYMAGQQHSLNQNLTAVSNANTTYLAGIDCYALISQPQADSKLAVLLRVGGNLVASAFCDPHGVTNSVTLMFQTTEFTSVDLIGKPFDFELVADLPDNNHLTFFDHARLTAYPSNGLSGLHPPIGPGKGQTARSAIRCAGSIICSVTLEFVDAGGVLLAQEQVRVPPGGIQTLDFSPARQGHDSME